MFLLLNSLVTEPHLCKKNTTRPSVKQNQNYGQITQLKPLCWQRSISSLKICTVNSILETRTKPQPNNWMKRNTHYYSAPTEENVSLLSVFFPTFFTCTQRQVEMILFAWLDLKIFFCFTFFFFFFSVKLLKRTRLEYSKYLRLQKGVRSMTEANLIHEGTEIVTKCQLLGAAIILVNILDLTIHVMVCQPSRWLNSINSKPATGSSCHCIH